MLWFGLYVQILKLEARYLAKNIDKKQGFLKGFWSVNCSRFQRVLVWVLGNNMLYIEPLMTLIIKDVTDPIPRISGWWIGHWIKINK